MFEEKHAETHLDRSTVAHGSIRAKGDVWIDGVLEGEAHTQGRLVISPTGRMKGIIETREAHVEGSIEGYLEAREIVRLSATSTVNSTVIAPKLEIQNCNRVQGIFIITPNATEREQNKQRIDALSPSRTPEPLRTVMFSTMNSTAREIQIIGSFNDWDKSQAIPLRPAKDGLWEVELKLRPGTYEYLVLIDGIPQPDPVNPQTVPNTFGGENSVLTVE